MIVVSMIDGVLCQRDAVETKLFPNMKERIEKLLAQDIDSKLIFINNGGNYAYRLFCEEQEWRGERPMVNPMDLPDSPYAVYKELDDIVLKIMGSPYPLLVSYAWYTEWPDGNIKMGGITPPEEANNPAWDFEWRLPRSGMLYEVSRVFEVPRDQMLFITSSWDGIKAGREAGVSIVHPLEL